MGEYRYSAEQAVMEKFAEAEVAEQSRLLAAFARLAAHPEQPCQFTTRGARGREYRGQWF